MATYRCSKLSKSFDGVQAVDMVTLEFVGSGITAIIGPNGAGKTTFLNLMTGFLRPDCGRLFLGEREITFFSPHQIARMGIARTFQDLRLINRLTAVENVLLARPNQRGEKFLWALLRKGWSKEESANRREAMRLLQLIELEIKADDLVGELSYGEQKLLTLACCLATEASILMLDEPVSGVAPHLATKIAALLLLLKKQGKHIVFIEHDMETVRHLADLVIVMDHGKIIIKGSAEDVLGRAEIIEAYLD